MVQECEYNPVVDVAAVEQNGFIDLAKANAMSSIPSDISNSDMSYNGIEDPNSIAGRPSDVFEAVQANTVIAGYKAPSKDESKE